MKYLSITTDNPSLVKIFPKDSIFWTYKRFRNLKDLMVHTDPYSIRPLKEIDQDLGCSGCE